jgi:hypothetical protein
MANPKLSVEVMVDTLRLWELNNKSIAEAARQINVKPDTFGHRLYKAQEHFPNGLPKAEHIQGRWTYPRMVHIAAPNSRWIIGSDLHVWTGEPTLIYKAFCAVAKKLKVDGIILNGDIIDGARISRHPAIRGSSAPKIDVEIETAKKWLKYLPNAKYKLWAMGNHDLRIDNYIAANANEMSDYILSLAEHFRDYTFSFAFELNRTLEVRHRFRGGIHGAWNNTLHSGMNIATGHTHQLQVTAMRDRNGSRWGIETGTLADPFGPQFEYSEGSPSRSQQGFAVITFGENGEMFPPELCEVIGGRPVFRGDHVL